MRRYQSIDEDFDIRADFVEMLVKLEERTSELPSASRRLNQ